MDTKIFMIEQDGLTLQVTAVVNATGGVDITVKALLGHADINAFYYSDGMQNAGDSSYSLGKSLNMNGEGSMLDGEPVVWDGGIKLSDTGLKGDPASKATYLTEGESLPTFTINGISLADLDSIGIRATSTSTASGSIKGVAHPEPEVVAPANHFPDTQPKEISHADFYFTDPNDANGVYVVKVDNFPSSSTDCMLSQDMDVYLDTMVSYIIAHDDVLGDDAELLGVALKGGNVDQGGYLDYYAMDDNPDVNNDELPVTNFTQNKSQDNVFEFSDIIFDPCLVA